MSRQYNHPPLIEAICEFHFTGESEWDVTSPGLLYQAVKKDFPTKTQVMNISVTIQVTDEAAPAQLDRFGITRFSRADGSALIQVGANFVAVNHVRPYPSWDAFRPLIFRTLATYRQIVHPQRLQLIALRYINRIDFDRPTIDLEEYFNFYPNIGPDLPQNYSGFVASIQLPFAGGRDALTLNMTPARNEEVANVGVILEIVYFLGLPESLSFDEIEPWVETAHDRLEEAFEASITDALRQTFGERSA